MNLASMLGGKGGGLNLASMLGNNGGGGSGLDIANLMKNPQIAQLAQQYMSGNQTA